MIIINFGDEIEFSLHTYAFFRIKNDKEILLTSNDEYYTPDYKFITKRAYKKDKLRKNCLLNLNIEKVKLLLKNSFVREVRIFNNGDIIIIFDNDIKFEIIIDRLSQNYEYYSFIKFTPNYNAPVRESSHTIVSFKNSQLVSETEFLKKNLY